jgi:hypothetical protein
MTTNQAFQSQFGIRIHAQIQTVNGGTYEFQPEHLLCGECWAFADDAYAHATVYGAVSSGNTDGHSIHCSKTQPTKEGK